MPRKSNADTRIYVLDTNILLHEPLAFLSFKENDVVVPMTVLEELDYIKDSKKDNKKTISLNKTSSKTSKPNLSVTRINSPEKQTKSNIGKDFTGSIDFDEAERKRPGYEKICGGSGRFNGFDNGN